MITIDSAFPKHEVSLTLEHNPHKVAYETVEQALEFGAYQRADWVSDEQKIKAIETNDAWLIQWYPRTPVGFACLAASDLDVLLKAAREDGET